MTKFGNGEVIIMVDDSEADLHLAERCFRRSRLSNAWSAFDDPLAFLEHLFVEVAKEKAPMPALVLLDLNMPEMDGLAVLEKIRGHPLFVSLPTIMVMTHSDRESDRSRSLELGADGYWIKPSDLGEYVALFDNLLLPT